MTPKVPIPLSWAEVANLPAMREILAAMTPERIATTLLEKVSLEQAINMVRHQAEKADPPARESDPGKDV